MQLLRLTRNFCAKSPSLALVRSSQRQGFHTGSQPFVFGTKGQRFAALHSSPCYIPYKACSLTKSAAQKPYKVCGASSSVGRRPYWSYSVVACWGGYAAPAKSLAALAQKLCYFFAGTRPTLMLRMPRKKSHVVVVPSPA